MPPYHGDAMKSSNDTTYLQLHRYSWATAVVWTLVVLLSLLWNRVHSELIAQENARIQARAAYHKDILYRRWNSLNGGVYAPVSDLAKPNPYLDHPRRDLTSTTGLRLTLINPAYMLRLVYELEEGPLAIRGRITSLRPIRPENAPDAWEAAALQAITRGGEAVSELAEMDGADYMRLVQPLVTEKSCLGCHEKQGYREGEIRGGISVAVPMAPLRAAMRPYHDAVLLGHALLWLFGLGGIGVASGRLRRQLAQHREMEGALRESEERSRVLVEHAPFGLSIMKPDQRFEYLNPRFIETFGYTLAEIPTKSAWFEMAYPDPAYRKRVRKVWENDSFPSLETDRTIPPKTFRVRCAHGRDRVIRFNNVPLADGRQILTYEDISTQVEAEEALRKSEENLRFLSSGLLKAQENERRRIAYALHDELAQDLAVLTIQVKCIEEGLTEDQSDLRESCRKTRRHIIGIIENTRRLSQGLSPALLEELGLSAAIRRMIGDFTEQTGVPVSLDMEALDHLFRRETEVIVYRIFQEAFTNIRKHAEAARVRVSAVRGPEEVRVSIEDDGKGFRHPPVEGGCRPERGLGLIAMDERVRMLGRTLHRESRPGEGTRIVFSVPLDLERPDPECPPPADPAAGGA